MAERHFVALEDIRVGEVLAYSRGQTVTEQAVTENEWQDSVAAIGTKAAAEVQAEISGRDVSDFQTKSGGTSASRSTSAASADTEQKG